MTRICSPCACLLTRANTTKRRRASAESEAPARGHLVPNHRGRCRVHRKARMVRVEGRNPFRFDPSCSAPAQHRSGGVAAPLAAQQPTSRWRWRPRRCPPPAAGRPRRRSPASLPQQPPLSWPWRTPGGRDEATSEADPRERGNPVAPQKTRWQPPGQSRRRWLPARCRWRRSSAGRPRLYLRRLGLRARPGAVFLVPPQEIVHSSCPQLNAQPRRRCAHHLRPVDDLQTLQLVGLA